MIEVIFLICLALVWIVFASVQDLRFREVANWLNFSLIIFALGFRFFWSLFSDTGFGFFYQGLIGLGIFYLIGNLFYYSRFFAGGDAKLFVALGAVLPFSGVFLINVKIFVLWFFVFFLIGGLYGILWSVFLAGKNFKEFRGKFTEIFGKNRMLIYFVMFLGIGLMVAGFFERFLFYFGVLVFLMSYLYVYAKAVDEACMVKKISVKNLREGDWLYENLNIGRKILKAKWEGVSEKEIFQIRKKFRNVKIRQGIPFVPVFLISFLILIFVYFSKWFVLWNSFW